MTCEARYHGTSTAYANHGCRCPESREARRLYVKRLREGRQPRTLVDPTGTVRRIRALMAIGWPSGLIARELGWKVDHINGGVYHRDTVTRAFRDNVKRVYDKLSMTPGPSRITRIRALRYGYLPPLAYDDDTIDDPYAKPHLPKDTKAIDEVAVQRALDGERIQLRRNELLEAIRRGRDLGFSDSVLADRLGMKRTTIEHIRSRAGIPAQREAS